MPYSLGEISVRHNAISIYIKHLVYFFKLLIGHFKAPMITIEAEFRLGDTILAPFRNLFVHVLEGLEYCLPLKLYLIDEHCFQLYSLGIWRKFSE